MKMTIAALVLLVAFVAAEPPPSNSYLPPPPGHGSFPQPSQGLPQVLAARSQESGFRDHGAFGHGTAANGLVRNNLGGHGAFGAQSQARPQGRSHEGYDQKSQGYEQRGQGYEQRGQGYEQKGQGYEQKAQGYDQSAAFLARNGLEEANTDPANYNFGYMVSDHHEGTDFGHHEERQEERAQGEYHVVLPDGRKQTVSYEADERGFKPQISYEDTEDLTRAGYDSNANNFRSSGNQGNDGFHAKDGYQGNNGNHGKDGYQGNNGNHGKDGYQGNNGNHSKDGYQGNNGNHGKDGYQSNDGYQANGPNGASGRSGY